MFTKKKKIIKCIALIFSIDQSDFCEIFIHVHEYNVIILK